MKKFLGLLLSLALCLGMIAPVYADGTEAKIVVGDQIYERVLQALLAQTEDVPVTLTLESDIYLTGSAVVLGSSDYGGMFESTITVVPRDVTIDLNGYTLTGEEGCAVFEVQEGYKLTMIDSSADKSGKIVTQGDMAVDVQAGGTYIPAARIVVGDRVYDRVLRALMEQDENTPVTLTLESDIYLESSAVILGVSDYGGMFGEGVMIGTPHDVTIDLNGYTLTGDEGCAVFEVQDGYKLTIIDSSEDKSGQIVTQGDAVAEVEEGGIFLPLMDEPSDENFSIGVYTQGGVTKMHMLQDVLDGKGLFITLVAPAETAGQMLCAVYDMQGRMLGLEMRTVAADNGCISEEVRFDLNGQPDALRVMLLTGDGLLVPQMAAKAIE